MFWAIIVLPSPLGATKTTLLGSLRNSSDMSASIATRSHCLGQAQSKSLRGLKGPIWASAKRRSSERRARSCSSQSRRVGSHAASSTSCQWASRPLRCRALARTCKGSRSVLIGGLLEFVIGGEIVGPHGAILGLDVLGQGHGDGGRLLALFAPALEDEAHGIGVRHVALEGLENRGLELCGAVAGQELHQGRGDAAEIAAALGGANEQTLDCWDRGSEMIGGAVTAGGMLLCHQCRDVRTILDLGTLIEGAGMASEDVLAVEDAHLVEIGEQREHPAHVGMRDGIIVEVEADVGGLARDDHFALIDGIGVLRQGEEVWRLFGESLVNERLGDECWGNARGTRRTTRGATAAVGLIS